MASMLLLASAAFAQRYSVSTWRALYVGQVGDETVALDLSLGPADFVFARMALSGSTLVLDGVGEYKAEDESFWLEFREPEYRAPATTAADIAYYGYYDDDPNQPNPERLPLLATMAGTRDVTWEDDGRVVVITLTYMQALGNSSAPALEPREAVLERAAQYSYTHTQQGRIDVGYAYPRFSGSTAALNNMLEAAAYRRYAEWLAEGRQIVETPDGGLGWAWTHHEDVEVAGWVGPYRSLIHNFYYYTGGAHPLSHSESALYRVDGEEVSELLLADLFAPDSGWLETISAMLLEDLKNQDAAWVVDGSIESLEEEFLMTFTLGPAGLTFVFNTYEVGPYVQGDFASTIGYDVLLPLAADNGVIQQFAELYTGR